MEVCPIQELELRQRCYPSRHPDCPPIARGNHHLAAADLQRQIALRPQLRPPVLPNQITAGIGRKVFVSGKRVASARVAIAPTATAMAAEH